MCILSTLAEFGPTRRVDLRKQDGEREGVRERKREIDERGGEVSERGHS